MKYHTTFCHTCHRATILSYVPKRGYWRENCQECDPDFKFGVKDLTNYIQDK